MFTGIVQRIACVTASRQRGGFRVLELDLGELGNQAAVGDSVLVDGVCLTAAQAKGERVEFEVSAETLRLTTLGSLKPADRVNVELAMRPTDRFGGHFVSGHVDGVGAILEKMALPGETRLKIKTPIELAQLMVMKGSVAVDGISLTIAGLEKQTFEVSLIPHTLKATTIQYKGPGASVNIECDMIGKWVRKFLISGGETERTEGRLTLKKLQGEGF